MLSIILLAYNSNERIRQAYDKVSSIMVHEKIPFEFIVIDDGSEDDSFKIASELEEKHECVYAYQLSKNVTTHYSAFAGLKMCNGDCVFFIPDDEQQPYQTIVEMYRLWEKGEKLIIPYRTGRNDGFLSDLFSKLFYRTINALSDIKFPEGGADTFFIDRELIDIVNDKIHPINTSLMSEVFRLGFSPVYFPYVRPKGINNKSRWTFKKKFRLAKDTFFSSSTWPIRMITFLGIFFSVFSFCIIGAYSYVKLLGNPDFWGDRIPGWTSTIVIISFFSGLILFSLGMIAEYVWRIYEEVKNRPGYIIKKKVKH